MNSRNMETRGDEAEKHTLKLRAKWIFKYMKTETKYKIQMKCLNQANQQITTESLCEVFCQHKEQELLKYSHSNGTYPGGDINHDIKAENLYIWTWRKAVRVFIP